MNYKIIDKGSFTVIGKQTRITAVDGENFRQIPEFWDDCMKDGSYEWMAGKAGMLGILGVCLDLHIFDKGFFTYMIGIEEKPDTLPEGYASVTIPAATWAVFESIGPLPEAIQDITRRIFSEWFPATGYEHDCAPELEVYPEGDIHSPNYKCEVWIPVKK